MYLKIFSKSDFCAKAFIRKNTFQCMTAKRNSNIWNDWFLNYNYQKWKKKTENCELQIFTLVVNYANFCKSKVTFVIPFLNMKETYKGLQT